jgi:prepilin-type N-terminal cleavage/methylation domain-containing protein
MFLDLAVSLVLNKCKAATDERAGTRERKQQMNSRRENLDRTRGERGLTLLEMLMALALFSGIAMGMLVCFSRAATSDEVSSENMKARAAAARVMESIRDYAIDSFGTTYAYFNADPADDPGGYGTAPGNTVTLTSAEMPGFSTTVRIEFPDSDGQLYENITDAAWAMPRDLNGDDAVGAGAVTTTYKLLPVRVVVSWHGIRGAKTYSLVTLITAKEVQR